MFITHVILAATKLLLLTVGIVTNHIQSDRTGQFALPKNKH